MYGEDAHLEQAYEDRYMDPMHGDPMDEFPEVFFDDGDLDYYYDED